MADQRRIVRWRSRVELNGGGWLSSAELRIRGVVRTAAGIDSADANELMNLK